MVPKNREEWWIHTVTSKSLNHNTIVDGVRGHSRCANGADGSDGGEEEDGELHGGAV